MTSAILQIRGGVCVDSYGKSAGKGALVKWEHAPCIAAAQDTTLFVLRSKPDSRRMAVLERSGNVVRRYKGQ